MSATIDRSAVPSSTNVWEMAQQQLDDVAKLIGLNQSVHAFLREPKRVLQVSIPVRMDDGITRIFQGYRARPARIPHALCELDELRLRIV